jgi:hypothetical protein
LKRFQHPLKVKGHLCVDNKIRLVKGSSITKNIYINGKRVDKAKIIDNVCKNKNEVGFDI